MALHLRTLTTSRILPSAAYTAVHRSHNPATCTTPIDLTDSQRETLDSALRVDQAGEIAANYIYKGQVAILGRDKQVGPLIQVCMLPWCKTFH